MFKSPDKIFQNIGVINNFNDVRYLIDQIEDYILEQQMEHENCHYCIETEKLDDEISDKNISIEEFEEANESLRNENKQLKEKAERLETLLNNLGY